MNRNLTVVFRQGERSVKIYGESDDAAILSMGPVVRGACEDLNAADAEVRRITTEERKKRGERDVADGIFAKEYNKTRASILGRMPYAEVPPRASSMSTPDDLLHGAIAMDGLLAGVAGVDESHPVDGEGEAAPTGEGWAQPLLKQYRPQLVPVAKAHEEARVIAERLKESVDERGRKRAILEDHLLSFRRIVKDVHGPKSRQYQQLRNRGEPDNGVGDSPPVNPPSSEPAATMALVPG